MEIRRTRPVVDEVDFGVWEHLFLNPGEIRSSRATRTRGEFSSRRLVDRMHERLNDTPHIWGLIAVIFAYLALFSLVVVLTVAGR